jgi:hypothetical protein
MARPSFVRDRGQCEPEERVVDVFGNASCLRKMAASAAEDLWMARGCRGGNFEVMVSVLVRKRICTPNTDDAS